MFFLFLTYIGVEVSYGVIFDHANCVSFIWQKKLQEIDGHVFVLLRNSLQQQAAYMIPVVLQPATAHMVKFIFLYF